MSSLAARASAIAERVGDAPWPGHEHVSGWGVFGLPFDSGHVLALRVFPDNPFAPYRTVWHRDPDGHWSIYADAPRLDIACPRYYGAACTRTAHASIEVTWTGPSSLRVSMDEPRLEWTVTATASPVMAALNGVSSLLPLASWRRPALVHMRERAARLLGLGDIALTGTMPSGHTGILMPQRMYLVRESTATLDGTDLGRPARLDHNPTIGHVPLPARGIVAIGQAMWLPLRPSDTRTTDAELAKETS